MKHTILAIICLLTSSVLFAQTKDWKQMDEFHTVMSKSYHPVEEGNFKPMKANVDSLVQRAELWQASAVPAGYNAKEVKQKLAKLVNDCKAVKDGVAKNKNDQELKKLITTAHQTFHEIMEKGEE